MTAAPRVTVVVPAYNGEDVIGGAVETALAQTLESLEVVVVDDGSTDRTAERVASYAADDARVRLVKQGNSGVAAARNRGVAEARGGYIAFLDQDDRWHPRKLDLQAVVLDADPSVALVGCRSALIDREGRLLGWRLGGNASGDVHEEMLEWDMVSGGSVALVRRDAITTAGGFDTTLPIRSDWDMWIKLTRQHHFTTVTRTLVGYTRGRSGLSSTSSRMLAAGERVLAAACEGERVTDRRRRWLLGRDAFGVACLCLFDEQPREAWRCLHRSLSITPAPVLLSPRRVAVVTMLVLYTCLPGRVYDAVLGFACRVAFGLRRGQPFSSLP